MRLKRYIRTFIIVLSFFVLSENSFARQYVNSLSDFKTHTQTHIKNVNRLAMHLYYEHKHTLFKDVPEHALRKKLLLHDYEKLASPEELQEYGYDKEPFLNRLYDVYGKSKNESAALPALIHDMLEYVNRVDENFFRNNYFLNSDGSLDEVGHKIALIEKIADLVEREKNPISPEEFGVKAMKPAADFFQNDRDQALARRLAEDYSEVVNPNPLIYLARRRPSHSPVCARLFG